MSWDLYTTVYEVKGNLSRFIRALSRGDADAVIIKRYNRPVALMVPLGNRNKPALPPQTEEDKIMRARTRWYDNPNGVTRRPPPPPKIF